MPDFVPKWEPYAVSVPVAAQMICKSRYILYDAIRAGTLPAVKPYPNADYSIIVDDLKKWIRGEFTQEQSDGAA